MNISFYSDVSQADLYRQEQALCGVCPLLERQIIGTSCAGRPILAFSLGRGEPVLWAGAFHGSERLTAHLLLTALADLVDGLIHDQPKAGLRPAKLLDGCRLTVVPMVNPDGCFIARDGYTAAGAFAALVNTISPGSTRHYNANARGVDINHNFPAGWPALHKAEQRAGITAPASRQYGGPFPGSEPETTALMELCRRHAFRHVLAFHSQGEVIYYPTGKNAPARSREKAEILASLSGYDLAEPDGLAVGGGFKDYFCETFGRPGFTVEVGRGENPLPFDILPELYRQLAPMLMTDLLL